jgi:hypothetical protein
LTKICTEKEILFTVKGGAVNGRITTDHAFAHTAPLKDVKSDTMLNSL